MLVRRRAPARAYYAAPCQGWLVYMTVMVTAEEWLRAPDVPVTIIVT